MEPSDRAAWLVRVEGMTREERIEALVDESAHTVIAAVKVRTFILAANADRAAWHMADAAHHANRALDLIAALERSAQEYVLGRVEYYSNLRAEAKP